MADISLALTGVSATGQLGLLQPDTRSGDVLRLRTPVPTLAMSGVTGVSGLLRITLPAPQLALDGAIDTPGRLTLTAPLAQFALAGVTGINGTLRITTPTPALQLFSDSGAVRLVAPLPTLTLAGNTGAIGSLVLRTPAAGMALTGTTEVLGTLRLDTPAPQLALSALTEVAGRFNWRLPRPALTLSGETGIVGALALLTPAPTITLTGAFAATGVLALTYPLPQLVLGGFTVGTTAQVDAARQTWAFQTERGVLTEYTNFPFNSFAVFAGRRLGASSDGIFELVGDTDAGTQIDAVARTGVSDLGTSNVKAIDRVYVGYRSPKGEALLLRTWTNETQQRDYAVRKSVMPGIHGSYVRLGRGVESRYWQFELRNREGADFQIDTLQVAATPMRRRRGDKDA